jgi:hypothetical protein
MIVNLPVKNRRWEVAALWAAAATTLIYTLSRFLPTSLQLYNSVLDNSWKQVLQAAFDQRWQFGRDMVFTCGPWGFLGGGYSPQTFAISLVLWTLLSLMFWWTGWRLARHLSRHALISWVWLMGLVAVTGMSVEQSTDELSFDIRLAAWPMLLLWLHFFVEERPLTPGQAGLAISLGLLSLTKFTGLIESAIIIAIIAADNVLRQRRFPWLALLFAASLLFFWVAAGQTPGSLGPFLRNSGQITGGYTEAMSLTGDGEATDIVYFLLAAGFLLALTGYAAWKRHRYFGLLPLTGLGAVIFLTFKQGYVRYGEAHTIRAVWTFLAIALAGVAATWPVLRKEKPWTGVAGLFLLAGLLVFSGTTFSRWYPKEGLAAQCARTFSVKSLRAPVTVLCHPGTLQKEYETYLNLYRGVFPFPPLAGQTDIYPWNQAALLAHGLAYCPRPVFQSYSAYTPELAELNAAHLRSGRAADNLLFTLGTLDRRFPSLDDGRSWPELLTRYDIQGTIGPFPDAFVPGATASLILMKKSPAPREYHLAPLTNILIDFAAAVALPPATNGPIWAELEINKTLAGSAVSIFYKPPILTLAVSLRDGRQRCFRLVPGLVRGGFLLSPLIDDSASFIALASRDGWRGLINCEITSFTVYALTQSGSTICYQSPMRLRLYRLDYPRLDLPTAAVESAASLIPRPSAPSR